MEARREKKEQAIRREREEEKNFCILFALSPWRAHFFKVFTSNHIHPNATS